MSTQIRKGIEIFSVGTWNRNTFAEADLDSMVESFDVLELSGRVPLKLGHEGPDGRVIAGERDKKGNLKDPLSQFAMGWVNKIYRKGAKLFADIEISDKVAKLIDDKFLRFVSVEIFSEVRASRKIFPWVLDAVALLGTDNPAVGVLSDIQTLAMSHRSSIEAKACLAFAREDRTKSFSLYTGVTPKMADKDDEQTLADQVLKLSQRMAALEQENSALKLDVQKGQQAENRLKQFTADQEAKDIKNHRAMVTDTLENAVKSEDILPAARDRFLKIYRVADDTAVMEIDKNDVSEFIRENPNPKKPNKQLRKFAAKSSNDDVPDDVPADQAVTMLTFAQLREDGIVNPTDADFERAAIKVLQHNTPVATRYKKFTAEAHGLEG